MNRRDLLGSIALGGGATLLASKDALAEALAPKAGAAYAQAVRGTGPVKIRDIKTILTAPNRIRLVVVKVETTEPGLFGWGCATFTQRALVVQTAVEQYLQPFLIGRNVDEIEDIWQSSYMSWYWRNGGVLFNAMSGVDIALWDIKGKRAGMPLYQLLGGKVRHGADCYYHASGASFTEVEENARRGMEQGFRHVRVQVSTPGYASYGARSTAPAAPAGATERGRRAHQPARHLGAGPLRADAAQVLRAHAQQARRRGRAAARRARAHHAQPGGQSLQGARTVPAVLPRGSVPARGQRSLPHPAPADQHPAGDGRAVQHAAGVPAAHQGAADRFHPHPHLADRRPEPGAEGRGAVASTSASAPHGTARATRPPSRTPRSSRSSSPATTSASTKAAASRRRRRRCSSAARR